MTWEDFQTKRRIELSNQPQPFDWVETDIECPECGAKLYTLYGITLASCPPQHEYNCKKCGWHGYGF